MTMKLTPSAAPVSWMIEGRSRLGLVHQFPLAFGIGNHFTRQQLESDQTIQLQIAGLVHDAHSALAQPFEDFVVGKSPADHLRRERQVCASGLRPVQGRPGEKAAGLLVLGEQPFHLQAHSALGTTGPLQKRGSLPGLKLKGSGEQVFHLLPLFGT
jgi:hypothetical protein